MSDSHSGGTDTDTDRAKPGSFSPDSGSSGFRSGRNAPAVIPARWAAKRPPAPAIDGAHAATPHNQCVYSYLSTISSLGHSADKERFSRLISPLFKPPHDYPTVNETPCPLLPRGLDNLKKPPVAKVAVVQRGVAAQFEDPGILPVDAVHAATGPRPVYQHK